MSEAALAERIARSVFASLPSRKQVDKGGRPYVDHFQRVASRVEGDWTKAVAWLHDTVEDTDQTLATLELLGVGPVVLGAVQLLTHDENETYQAYVDRIWRYRSTDHGRLAYSVKIADLCDNLDVRRSAGDADGRLRRKHQPALDRLLHGTWLTEPLG